MFAFLLNFSIFFSFQFLNNINKPRDMCHALKDTDVDFCQFYGGRWTKGPSLFLTLSEVPFTMQIKTEVSVCKVVKPRGLTSI